MLQKFQVVSWHIWPVYPKRIRCGWFDLYELGEGYKNKYKNKIQLFRNSDF